MRALTLTQPWAGLVASGIKLIENRPRAVFARGSLPVRFAIHAGREIDESVYSRIIDIAPDLVDPKLGPGPGRWQPFTRITSAVIAVATCYGAVVEWRDGSIVDAHGVNGGPVIDLGDQRRWFFGTVGYQLRDVVALKTPVPCRGWQGLWTLQADIAARVEELLA